MKPFSIISQYVSINWADLPNKFVQLFFPENPNLNRIWYLGMPRGTWGIRSLRSPVVFPRPVPRWLEFSPPVLPRGVPAESNYFDIFFFHFLELFYKKMVWLSLILISSIPHYPAILSFLIMKIILFFWFRKKILKEISNLLQIWDKMFPEIPQTRNPGNRF